ncbi:TonB-dependent receptor [Parvularcula flava]|uniref:TonB-dependent receptor n=1 Tax=Aquisalinus luteolus TaxID=1566827 RepID=A0A8J3ER79_9PROT|nr:TonB-dependent receptor [Aquisalinus luteolus]NHK27811.1 TonB-dependent receptor [Aquisalinus luteolus]GGH96573.1 TonB-dependent receptor [Aquisalinus luteolus]
MGALDLKKLLLGSSLLVSAAAFSTIPSAYAQDDDDVETIEETEEEQATPSGDLIVVTGSRLRRSEYDSPKPLRVLQAEEAREEGLFTAADVLQSSSIASGVQFDATFTGLVTDSGPGSSTINLRGLGADRNVVLLNGRRLAPAGVGGAPTRPDLNLLPSGIISQYDVLLDGASSVYGSDAVTGVINAIIRTDFEGVEMRANMSKPEHGGGEELQLTFTAGTTSDRGNILFGAEYYQRDVVKRGQRGFTPCERDIEINPETGETNSYCQQQSFGSMVLDPLNALYGDFQNNGIGTGFGLYYFDFAAGDGYFYVPNNNQFGGPGSFGGVTNLADPTGDPVIGISSPFVYENAYNANRFSDDFDLIQGVETFSAYSGGEYELTDSVTSYFEFLYSSRNSEIDQGAQQIFPAVSCLSPNIANHPDLSQAPVCTTPGVPDSLRELVFTSFIDATGNTAQVEVSQARFVGGLKGDLEFLIPSGKFVSDGNFGVNVDNWVWDAYASYDRSNGNLSAIAVNEERIVAATRNLTQNSDGSYSCSPTIDGDLFGFISPEDCVPLDLTDPSIYINGALPQDFLDYAAGNATNRTVIDQQLVNIALSGDVFRLPDGVVPFVFGIEYREDRIESYNDYLTSSGAAPSVAREGNTFGTTDLMEFFMETELPLLRGRPLAEELTLNLSARWTEEKNFGALWTYAANVNYLPYDWLRFRGTYGTTYKAPNLRQQFLAGQTAFAGAFGDPCIASTFDNYSPEDQAIIRPNCIAQGADPDTLGQGGATSIPFTQGGNGQSLNAETSEGYTLGVSIEQPWFDRFDLRGSATYYSYEIENSIVSPSVGFILNDCLVEFENLSSAFCSRIQRLNTGDPSRNFISDIDASFLNSGSETAVGVDYSINFDMDFVFNEKPLDLSLSARLNNTLEREEVILDVFQDYLGEFGTPKWRGDFRARADYGDFALIWTTDYIGEVEDSTLDPLREASDVQYDFRTCGTITNDPTTGRITGVDPSTCQAVTAGVGFRDKEEAGEYFLHDLALNYSLDTWSITGGVRNIFDTEPPLVDAASIPSTLANVPLGRGYDVFGRSFFLSIVKDF